MSQSFSIQRTVQFCETDMAGIMHFANYFRMMEEVEHAFFRSRGLSIAMEIEGEMIGWPRVKAGCEYFGPVRFEDQLELKLSIVRLGEKSFSYEVEFLNGPTRVSARERHQRMLFGPRRKHEVDRDPPRDARETIVGRGRRSKK